MSENTKPRFLVVGAGSMGLITAYHLYLGGAEITFLIRPHREEQLKRPQKLYCYDDNKTREFKDYSYITEPSKMIGANYDYILFSLDGIAMKNETGQALVQTVGQAVRQTSTKVILITVAFDVRSWFLKTSGIAEDQLACGFQAVHAYSPKSGSLPLYPQVNRKQVEEADLAYADRLKPSIYVEDTAPEAANGFMKIYNAAGVSPGVVIPATQVWLSGIPNFAVLGASNLLGWPKVSDIDVKGEIWSLGIAAAKEIQTLGIYGETGQQMASQTTEAGIHGVWSYLESSMLPLNFQEFNQYHHGGKVNAQDREILHDCVASGTAEGKPMTSLKDLLQRLEKKSSA